MLKYRGAGLIKAGFIGAVLIVLVILVGLSPDRLVALATSVKYQALFSEAGGLAPGNPVTVSGIKVGAVSDVALRNGDALVTFTMKGNVPLGTDTTAHIRTGTLLGERVLDAQHKILLRIGPMPLARYEEMLPGNNTIKQIAAWIKNYVGIEYIVDIQLLLRKEEVPQARLGSSKLGWTSWLGERPHAVDADDLVMNCSA